MFDFRALGKICTMQDLDSHPAHSRWLQNLLQPFLLPRPPTEGSESGTEKALIQLQNRDFVILGQNLPDFCHRLGDARSEPGMTGRRFRVSPE